MRTHVAGVGGIFGDPPTRPLGSARDKKLNREVVHFSFPENGTLFIPIDTYTYDGLHRLESESGGTDPINYEYNEIGNITSRTIGATVFDYAAYDVNHPHAVQTINLSGQNHTYTYDGNGNMTSGPDFTNAAVPRSRSIQYNADNMPTRIQYGPSEITSFTYDGNNTRAVKLSPGGKKTLYVSNDYEVVDGVAHKYIFAGNLRVAMIKGADTLYFHKDHLNSSTVMTRQDGAVYESTQYLPYGGQRGANDITETDYKFTDQELDRSTGLYNYDARLYDPVIGRFVSADSVVPKWYDPSNLNRYSYCLNNPLKYRDPSGHFVITATVAGELYYVKLELLPFRGQVFKRQHTDWQRSDKLMIHINLETKYGRPLLR